MKIFKKYGILLLILLIQTNSVSANSEFKPGTYQLFNSKHRVLIHKEAGGGSYASSEGTFKINTSTGQVWELIEVIPTNKSKDRRRFIWRELSLH